MVSRVKPCDTQGSASCQGKKCLVDCFRHEWTCTSLHIVCGCCTSGAVPRTTMWLAHAIDTSVHRMHEHTSHAPHASSLSEQRMVPRQCCPPTLAQRRWAGKNSDIRKRFDTPPLLPTVRPAADALFLLQCFARSRVACDSCGTPRQCSQQVWDPFVQGSALVGVALSGTSLCQLPFRSAVDTPHPTCQHEHCISSHHQGSQLKGEKKQQQQQQQAPPLPCSKHDPSPQHNSCGQAGAVSTHNVTKPVRAVHGAW